MYHADRDKGKCDLHDGRRQALVEREGRNQPEIELKGASDLFHPSPGSVPMGFLLLMGCDAQVDLMRGLFLPTVSLSREE